MSDTTPKPSDIASVLLNSQDIIDSAVATIAATRSTQDTLEENIRTTDKKIGVHNVAGDAHPDLRKMVEDMPPMLTNPEITGPDSVETGTEATWTLVSTVSPAFVASVSVVSFDVYDADGSLIQNIPVTTSGSNTAIFTHTFVGERNEQTFFTVQAQGSYESYRSKAVKKELLITHHLPPDMTQMSCTLPDNVTGGGVYTFRIGNIIDLDGDVENVTISCSETHFTFSETTIQPNTDYTLTVDAGYNGPLDVPVIFTAHDAWGLSSSATVMVHLNAVPVVDTFAHTFPTYPNPNSSFLFRVSGVTDPDGTPEALKCSLVSDNPALTFSKSENISLNEDVMAYMGEVAAATPINITCTFTDPDGGATTTSFSTTINTPPDTSAMVVTKDVLMVPGQTYTISVAGAVDANGEAVTYEIANQNAVLTFSKLTGIAPDEQITVSVDASAVHGQTYSVYFVAVDASAGRTTVTIPFQINSLPVVTAVTTTLPTYVAPTKSYTGSFNGATDLDGQGLTYTITCDNSAVVLSGNVDVSAGSNISLTVPDEATLPRGSTISLLVTVSDGLETNATTINLVVNPLPTTDDVTSSISGGSMQGGTGTITIGGGADTGGGALTYNIINPVACAFTKTTGIAPGEQVTMVVPKVARPTEASFDVTTTDVTGETSAASKHITFMVQPIYITYTPTITSPANGAELEYEDGVNVIFTPCQLGVQLDDHIEVAPDDAVVPTA